MNTNADRFLSWAGKNYDYQKDKLQKWCSHNKYRFDEDIFSDTIIKVYDIIQRNDIKDPSDKGFDDYFFIAFKNNLKREKEYCRTKNRMEITGLTKQYEDYYNNANDSSTVKIMKDLKEDFSVLYLLRLVEGNFDSEHLYCFKMKFLYKLTYKQLQRQTNIKNSRQKVIDVIHWLKNNLTKDELEKAFELFKGDFL